MKLLSYLAGAALALSAAALGQPAAASSVLYDSGPIAGSSSLNIYTSLGQQVGGAFTVTHDSVATGVTFGVWTDGLLTNVDWGITDQYGTVPDDGTAAVTVGALFGTNAGFDIHRDSFSIGPVNLTAGTTYYLWLQNATDLSDASWDTPNNAGLSYLADAGFGFNGTAPDAPTFQILGAVAGVPEPATWAMMLLGVGVLGASLRTRRRTSAAAA